MLKYKVGQRVKVAKGSYIGAKGIIEGRGPIDETYNVILDGYGSCCFEEDYLQPLSKTLDTLAEGDVLNNALGLEFVVLGVCGQAVFCQKTGEYVITRSISDLKSDGWTVKQDDPEEPEEVTVAQLERERGHKVKIVKG